MTPVVLASSDLPSDESLVVVHRGLRAVIDAAALHQILGDHSAHGSELAAKAAIPEERLAAALDAGIEARLFYAPSGPHNLSNAPAQWRGVAVRWARLWRPSPEPNVFGFAGMGAGAGI